MLRDADLKRMGLNSDWRFYWHLHDPDFVFAGEYLCDFAFDRWPKRKRTVRAGDNRPPRNSPK